MVGERIAGRYVLAARLGSGGTASVWRASDVEGGVDVAIKLLHVDVADNPEVLARFEREARLLAAIASPNVVALRDRGTHDDRPFLVFDLVDGESLRERLRRDGPLPMLEACAIAEQLSNGLAAAHAARLVHRDMKPANVLIAADAHVKVADFGIARALEEPGITQPGRVLGTGEYVSPEQALGTTLDARSDLYSLGVVLYEMLAGRPPFRGSGFADVAARHVRSAPPSLVEARPDAPATLVSLVAELLEKQPDARPPSAVVVRERLRGIMAELALAEPDVEPTAIVDTALTTGDDAPEVLATPVARPARKRAARRVAAPASASPPARDDVTGEVEVAAIVDAAFTLREAMPDDLAPWEDVTPPSMEYAHRSEPSRPRVPAPRGSRSIVTRAVAIGAVVVAAFALSKVIGTARTSDPATAPGIITLHSTGPSVPQSTAAATTVATGTTTASDLPMSGVQAFDPRPGGDGAENDDQASNAIDGEPTGTWWETEIYHNSGDLSGGKGGVGIAVELTSSSTVATVVLQTPVPGFTVTLYTARAVDPPATLGGWKKASGAVVIQKKRQRVKVTANGAKVRYLLVWITKLAVAPNGFSARLSDIRPDGV